HGRSTFRVLPKTFCATESWPVEIQVRPQHTAASGITTSNPADSSSATAARPIWGSKRLANVSGHTTTVVAARGSGSGRPAVRSDHHARSVWSEKAGASRSTALTAAFLTIVDKHRELRARVSIHGHHLAYY